MQIKGVIQVITSTYSNIRPFRFEICPCILTRNEVGESVWAVRYAVYGSGQRYAKDKFAPDWRHWGTYWLGEINEMFLRVGKVKVESGFIESRYIYFKEKHVRDHKEV